MPQDIHIFRCQVPYHQYCASLIHGNLTTLMLNLNVSGPGHVEIWKLSVT